MTARKAAQGKSVPAAKAAGADSSAKEDLTVETDSKTTIIAGPQGGGVADGNATADAEGVEMGATNPVAAPDPDGADPAVVSAQPDPVATNTTDDPEASKVAALALLAQGATPAGADDPVSEVAALPRANGAEVRWGNGRTRAIVTGTMVTGHGENGAQYQGFQGDTLIAGADIIDKLERLGAVHRLDDLDEQDG